jgi:hypothetical protein
MVTNADSDADPHTPEPPADDRATSTTPTQPTFIPKACAPTATLAEVPTAAPTESLPPAPIFVAPTLITNPKSEIQMMMEAMANMSKEFKNAITDLNVKVSNIQQGIIPSSQPHADYGDFTIDENSNWVGADDPLLDQVNPDSRMTDLELQEDAEDHFAIKLYQCLVETEVITPGTFHPSSYSAPHDKFSTFFRRLCKTHSWLLTEFPSSEQLPIVAHTWSAHILERDNKETLWAARNLFGQLSHPIKHYADHPTSQKVQILYLELHVQILFTIVTKLTFFSAHYV